MLENNGNYQQTALETVKYEVHGGGFQANSLNHQHYEKPGTSRGLKFSPKKPIGHR